MVANNVVQFPRVGIGPAPQTVEEVKNNKELVRQTHVEDTLEIVFEAIMTRSGMMGFNLADDRFDKNIAFVTEAIKALLCKYYEIEHPFQLAAEQTFEVDTSGTTRFVGDSEPVLEPVELES